MKKKRTIKVNPRRISEADIAVGERIRARRNQMQMSQEELSRALGVSFQQVQKYENGRNRITSGRLLQIVVALKCSVTDLVGSGDDDPIKSTEFSRYAASKEGVAIINAMARIPSSAVRRQLLSLAESLSVSVTP